MEFIDYTGRGGIAPEAADDAGDLTAQQPPPPHFNHTAASAMPEHANPPYFNANIPHPISCDIKPRLTKEQHDILEAHYQKQQKPNTNTKKGFAEALNVSLDKVNNWFQNRRAKSKQDAKKQASAFNIYPQHQSLSDTETSPTFAPPSSEYIAMMQAWSADNQAPNGLGISQVQQAQEQMHMRAPPMDPDVSAPRQFPSYAMSQHLHPSAFDSDPELKRTTLTQEQFDAMNHVGTIATGAGSFEPLQLGFQGEPDFMNQVLSEQVFTGLPDDFKQQEVWAFPHPVGAPLPSNDSTIPSSISEQSLPAFPSSNMVQNGAGLSAPHSEWSDSRSSSMCSAQQDGGLIQQQAVATTSQWQPGQSVPVDFNAMHEEFRQVAQGAHVRGSPQQPSAHEQPLAWPADEAFVRRGSSASMLAHSMSNVELQTPQAPQTGTFKSPAPPSSIAARRQRKPAALGLASLRSQSYSAAAGQPGSPGHGPQQAAFNATQTLRRIRSSNVVGSAPQGRVMKSLPGSAQRSPLSWTFADALNSPHAVRHPSAPQSQGNLAPPTPLSPSEFPRQDQAPQVPTWPTASGHVGRHPSISETDVEHRGITFPATVPTNTFSSPPHTPMFYQTHFVQQRIGSNVITENTPPQSAPASQTCFPANAFTVPQQPAQSQPQTQAPVQQQAMAMSQAPQYVSVAVPDPRFQMPSVTYVPTQQTSAAVTSAPNVPVQFSSGVPVVDAEGNLQLAFPPQIQYVPHPAPTGTPPQAVYPFGTSAIESPNMQATAQPKQVSSSELFVHEYSPPDSLKRSATVRKPVDTGPKNYTFANAGPEHFEEKAKKKESSVSSGSPASSTGAASAP